MPKNATVNHLFPDLPFFVSEWKYDKLCGRIKWGRDEGTLRGFLVGKGIPVKALDNIKIDGKSIEQYEKDWLKSIEAPDVPKKHIPEIDAELRFQSEFQTVVRTWQMRVQRCALDKIDTKLVGSLTELIKTNFPNKSINELKINGLSVEEFERNEFGFNYWAQSVKANNFAEENAAFCSKVLGTKEKKTEKKTESKVPTVKPKDIGYTPIYMAMPERGTKITERQLLVQIAKRVAKLENVKKSFVPISEAPVVQNGGNKTAANVTSEIHHEREPGETSGNN